MGGRFIQARSASKGEGMCRLPRRHAAPQVAYSPQAAHCEQRILPSLPDTTTGQEICRPTTSTTD